MRRLLIVMVVVTGVALGCEPEEPVDEPDAGPTEDADGEDAVDDVADDVADDVETDVVDNDEIGDLRESVEVYTDDQGTSHVYAETLEDLFWMNGYIKARDRLGQMEFYRRVSSGTLSEIVGGFSDEPIDVDVMFRTLGIHRTAREYWEEHYDPENESHLVLEHYAAGVNAFLEAWRDGEEEVNDAIAGLFPPEAVRDWEPYDSLAVAKLLSVQLTYYAPMYLELTELRRRAGEEFSDDADDPALAARSGIFTDLVRFAPATDSRHVDGFPNAAVDPVEAPGVSEELLANARRLHRGLTEEGPLGVDFDPFNARRSIIEGSNNWVVSGDHTESGYPQVANDPHLGLSLPTVFHPVRLVLEDDPDGREDLDLRGVGYPGAPGVVIGHTDSVAWGTTVTRFDYVDVYLEELSGPAGGDEPATVEHDGEQVEVEVIEETIGVGQLGNISEEIDLTIEVVPHRGPLLVPMEDGRPVERQDTEALSVRWVGHETSSEFEFLTRLWRAENPQQVDEALQYYSVGAANFVFGFPTGDIYYSTQTDIPLRAAGATTFHPRDNPEGTAPFFVLPGDGTADWEGFVPREEIPHVENPESGYVITANDDPAGTTFDNDPFDAEHYLGAYFDIGYRGARVDQLLSDRIDDGQALTPDDHAALQEDGRDGLAADVVPHIVEAIDVVVDDDIDDEEYVDLGEVRDDVDDRTEDLQQLRDLLTNWDYHAVQTRNPEGEDADRSAAAVLFNTTMVYLLRNVFGDEMARLDAYEDGDWDFPQVGQALGRSLVFLLESPEEAESWSSEYQEALYFDDLERDGIQTRLTMLIKSVLQARDRLELSSDWGERSGVEIDGPESGDPADWVWGRLHGLFLDGLLPGLESMFARPQTAPPFYERPGGSFTVSPCGNDYTGFNFTCTHGAALRIVFDVDPDDPTTRYVLPGGVSEDPDSPHFLDQIERWNDADPYRMPNSRDELESIGEPEVFGGE